MYRALVYSIPGSGTRFTANVLERVFGYQLVSSVDQLLTHPEQSPVYAVQAVNELWKLDPAADNGIIKAIVPLRPPVATYLTRRGGKPDGTDIRGECVAHWAQLKDDIDRYDHVVMPLEAGFDHRRLLRSVAQHLDAEIQREAFDSVADSWDRIGQEGPPKGRPEYLEYLEAGEVIVDGRGMVFLDEQTRWYNSQLTQLDKQ